MVFSAIQSKYFIYSIVNAATGFCVFLKVCYYGRFSNRTWIECSSKGKRSHPKNWVLCLKKCCRLKGIQTSVFGMRMKTVLI
jgi:hypothetical protein